MAICNLHEEGGGSFQQEEMLHYRNEGQVLPIRSGEKKRISEFVCFCYRFSALCSPSQVSALSNSSHNLSPLLSSFFISSHTSTRLFSVLLAFYHLFSTLPTSCQLAELFSFRCIFYTSSEIISTANCLNSCSTLFFLCPGNTMLFCSCVNCHELSLAVCSLPFAVLTYLRYQRPTMLQPHHFFWAAQLTRKNAMSFVHILAFKSHRQCKSSNAL